MPTRKHRLLDFLFRRHGPELLAFAGQRSGSDIAEDLVQEAYLRLLQHDDPDTISNPRAYLYKVTANLGIDHFRRERHLAWPSEEELDFDALPSPLPGPETSADGSLRFEHFLVVLGELPAMQRDAFILHKLDGLSYPDVAKNLGISPKTAQRYILKAWQHCLHRLGQ